MNSPKGYTKYQQSIIRNYYDNIDTVSLQKLGELVGTLYLSEGKSRQKHWKAAAAALARLKVPESRIEHVIQQDDPAMLARLLEELQGKPAVAAKK